jgi:adenosine deaminase
LKKMCKSSLHPLLARLPKCEHHIHLEGAMTSELLFSLAKRNAVKLPDPEVNSPYASEDAYTAHLAQPDAFENLDSFLSLYYIGVSVLQQKQDFHDLGMTYFRRAAEDNVRHAEVFFDPQAHTNRGVALQIVVDGFKSACLEAETSLGITTNLIMCFLRHLPAVEATQTYRHASSYFLDGTISGIGLDSSEKDFPPELFKEVYDLAVKDGVRRTAHAGEEAGPQYVINALEHLNVQRIDHGRTIPQDLDLLAQLAKDNTLITLCPLSNLKLQGVASLSQLPIRNFLDAGLKFSINSDDPAYFGGFALDNYCAVQETFQLKVEEWKGICSAAIEGSWCDLERKNDLLAELEQVVNDFH